LTLIQRRVSLASLNPLVSRLQPAAPRVCAVPQKRLQHNIFREGLALSAGLTLV
jgi:hypothetical protein